MQCTNCGNEVAVLAQACPNCGQPGLGSLIPKVTLTPEEEARQVEFMGKALVGLLMIGAGLAVLAGIAVIFMWIGDGLSQIPFGEIFGRIGNAFATLFKWLAIVELICLPFALMGGYLATTAGRPFSQGYWWGQLLGPVGVVVVVLKPSEEEPHPASPQRAASVFQEDRQEMARIAYTCPNCGKRYKVFQASLGKNFKCTNCGEDNIVVDLLEMSD